MRLAYYLVFKPISLMPWGIIYFLSDFLYVLMYKIFRYRIKVVNTNLYNSLPHKTHKEIAKIRDRFYSHFFDFIMEGIKLLSATTEDIMGRMSLTNPELLNKYFEEGRDIILCGGHYSSWEFTTLAFQPRLKHQTSAIYHQFKNKFFEKIMLDARSKAGMLMVSRSQVKEGFYNSIIEPIAILFGTDQSPTIAKKVYWTTFLGQETAVAFGAEKFAKERNAVVVWADNEKLGRSKFEVSFKVLTDTPLDKPHGQITEMHVRALEEQILREPAYWLWTHKRWKRKRKAGEE